MKILLATGNEGKLIEMQKLFKDASLDNIEIVSLKELEKVEEPEETESTFLGNAYLKAMYYYKKFHMPVISDDTGLLVDALNGAPGIYTARYGSIHGEHTDPVKNYTRLIHELEGIKNRKCHFETAVYFYDGKVLINALGRMDGEIAEKPSGIKGFGYDPVFYIPSIGKTASEISREEKNAISHRGMAIRNLLTQLVRYFNE